MADVERVTRVVGQYAVAFALTSPVWLMLLVLIPLTGLGPGLSFVFASLLAGGAALAGRRWFLRNAGARGETTGGAGPLARARALSPAVRWTMVLFAGLILLYVVLVTRAG